MVGTDLVRATDITRRGFLGGVVAGAAVLAISSPAQALRPRASEPMPTIVLRRREDLLRLVIAPFNMTIDKRTERVTPNGSSSFLIVSFGPQAVTEKAFEPTAKPPSGAVAARLSGGSQLSFRVEESVALTLPGLLSWAEHDPHLSQIGRYLNGEVMPSDLQILKPSPTITMIEMPWWLVLSPNRLSSWTEQVRAKTYDGRSEVFHTRLASMLPGEGQTDDPEYRTLRGIWITDPNSTTLFSDPNLEVPVGQPGHPFTMIPTPRDRADIVNLTTHTGAMQAGGQARAIKARVALSPLGGQLVAEGAWDEPGVSSMTSWQQRIWQGRDTYAKVVRRGFLYPWGFKAAQIEEGVRVFRADADGAIRAFWEKRTMVAITEPEVNLGDTSTATDAGKRAALFSSVTCITKQTPPLVLPGNLTPMGGAWAGMKVYTPKVATRNGTTAFQFDLIGIDPDGNEIPFSQPLLFAQQKVADTSTTRPSQRRAADGRFGLDDLSDPNFTDAGAAQLRNYYDENVPYGDKVAEYGGTAIAYAENLANSVTSDDGEVLSEASASNQTQQSTKEIVFGIANSVDGAVQLIQGEVEDLLEEYHPNNIPVIKEAKVFLEDTARIAQEAVEATLTQTRAYIENAFDDAKNKGQVYLQQAEGAANELLMDAAKAGGVVAPNVNVAGLSRKVGNVYGDVQSVRAMAADGRVTPGEAFAALKLLGGVSLADILPVDGYAAVDENGEPTGMALSIDSTFVDTGLDSERMVVTMSMTIEGSSNVLQSIPLLSVDDARLAILLTSEIPTVSGSAAWSARGEFSNFIVHLVPVDGLEFVNVDVERIIFTAGSGKGADVDVKVREVDFSGLLTLVKKLASLLPFGDMLIIDVNSSGVKAGFFFELPTLAFGAFAISGLGVGAELAIPFDSRPVRFGFLLSMPDNPFSLTVTGLGGGGWLENSLGLNGIERLSIAGFVAAEVKVDFGVAGGGVSVRAGFQFQIGALEPPIDGVEEGLALTAFASLNGYIDVLGIASASLDVYIGLSVVVPAELPDYVKLYGIATCTMRVSLAFYTESVTFEVKRSINATYLERPGRSGGRALDSRVSNEIDPATFADAWDQQSWAKFCGAFG